MKTNDNVEYKEIPTNENGNLEKYDTHIPTTYGYGIRHIQVLLTFLSLAVAYVARAHIGVIVVAMTNTPTTHNYTHKNTEMIPKVLFNETDNATTVWEDVDYDNIIDYDGNFEENLMTTESSAEPLETSVNTSVRTYNWPKSTQEMVLGAFFLGYSIAMFPMGLVCQRWGGKLPIQLALLVNGVISVAAPWLVAWGGWKAVCACRFIQGLTQAGIYPSIQTLLAKWSHHSERGKFISYVYTGTTLGTILAFQVSGVLSASKWGWPSAFWFTGGLCILMFVIITIFGAASPAEHRSISEEEKKYIMGLEHNAVKKNRKVPWKAILTSKCVWANIATQIGSGLSYIFFFVQVPSYIHFILNVNVKKSGILSSLPYIFSFFTNLLFGFLADFLTNRKILSVANTRRVYNSFAQLGLAVGFIGVSFTKNVELAVFFLVFALSSYMATHTGWMLNHIDIAPNYTGTLMAIGNTLLNASSLLLPVFASYVVTDVTNQIQWRIMLLTIAVFAVITNAIFVVFMSADVQPWNDYNSEVSENAKDVEERNTQK